MRTLRVLRPIQSIEEVQVSVGTFGARIVSLLDDRRPAPEGEPADGAFSYGGLFDELGRELEALRLKVAGTDDEYHRRQAWSAAVGREADELRQALYQYQVGARRILDGAFTPDRGFELAGISGRTPQNFKPLEEQVHLTVQLLRDPVTAEPVVPIDGVEVDFAGLADGLETRLNALRLKRFELAHSRKSVDESKVLVDQVLDEFQGSFPWIAQTLESLARLAGERELAERIRTTIRRVTRRQGDDDGETAGSTETGDGTPDGEAPSEAPSPSAEPDPEAETEPSTEPASTPSVPDTTES